MEKEQSKKEGEVKYIEMAYDNITQLIQSIPCRVISRHNKFNARPLHGQYIITNE